MDLPRIIDESQMPQDLDVRIRAALCSAFARDAAIFSQSRAWHGSGPAFSAVIEDAGAVVAHVGVVDRTLHIGQQSYRAAGVQNVCVMREYRGRGLSDAVMRASMDEARRRGFDLGLLFCYPAIEKVYARTGWRLADRAVVRQEDGKTLPLPEGNVAMWLPMCLTELPQGTIDLCGNDW